MEDASNSLGSLAIDLDATDSDSDHEMSCDSPVYVYETSPVNGRIELRQCSNSVFSDVLAPSEYFDSDFLDQYRAMSPTVPPRTKCKRNKILARIRPPFNDKPLSTMKDRDIDKIRELYKVPTSVMLRVPLDWETADISCPNEVVVYEAYFALGLRETIPSLIAEVVSFFKISPGQFTPFAWRILTVIQVFSESYSVKLGIKEIRYAHYLRSHDIDASRYIIRRRPTSIPPLVYDIEGNPARNVLYEKDWQKKYIFMQVGPNPSFPTWCLRDVRTRRCEAGLSGAFVAFTFTRERCLVSVLIDNFSLERTTIWGFNMAQSDGTKGNGVFERFRLAELASSSRANEASLADPEPASRAAGKRSLEVTEAVVAPKPAKKPVGGVKHVAISPASCVSASSGHARIAAELKKAFSKDSDTFGKLGASVIFPQAQAELIKV